LPLRRPEIMQKLSAVTSLLVVLLLPAMLIPFFSRTELPLQCLPVRFQGMGGIREDVGDVSDIRYYSRYVLTRDVLQNARVLEEIRLELNKIKNNRDTHNGIEVHVTDNAPFQDYITCLDICRETEPAAFVCCGNEIYAMYVGAKGTAANHGNLYR